MLALLALAAGVAAHVRLRHPSNGNDLFWASPSTVGIVINSAGSDDIADGSHETAVRNAIAAWNGVDSTAAHLIENSNPTVQARTDWASDSIHLVWFDEANSSGYFPLGSGTVAVTPVWFAGSGQIVDADILFNGLGFEFTTSDEPGRFDVQDVAAHELGHLLGLDHSGCVGATMYPYVDTSVILHRSLSADDANGLRTAYPSGVLGAITGTVRRNADDSSIRGAHVVARDDSGRHVTGVLSEADGSFRLYGFPAGDYTVYATPLEGPVTAANLGAAYGGVETDFESTIHGVVTVAAQQTVDVGDVRVRGDVGLRLGSSADVYPRRAIAGTTQAHVVRGTGFSSGSTLTASDPGVTIVPISWASTQVFFNVTVPAGAEPGHVDLMVTEAGDRSILPGAFEITPADPTVTSVSPPAGDVGGGVALTISGTGFRAGARVVIGETIYPDGVPGGCRVLDSTTITLTTQPNPCGAFDVVVMDPTGVEGRRDNGFAFVGDPSITTLFPSAGQFTGSTEVILTGADFCEGLVVLIDGTLQSRVAVEPTRITVMTDGGPAGGPYVLEVRNPGGGVASAAFTYAATPDPAIAAIDPAVGSVGGGEAVTITGANFAPTAQVVFGADPDTGLGGAVAPTVTWVDATTLEVVTPSHGSGTQAVVVTDGADGQAAVAAAGFTFQGTPSSGGGGGGCHARIDADGEPMGPADAAWVLVLAAWTAWLGRRGRRDAASATPEHGRA